MVYLFSVVLIVLGEALVTFRIVLVALCCLSIGCGASIVTIIGLCLGVCCLSLSVVGSVGGVLRSIFGVIGSALSADCCRIGRGIGLLALRSKVICLLRRRYVRLGGVG